MFIIGYIRFTRKVYKINNFPIKRYALQQYTEFIEKINLKNS